MKNQKKLILSTVIAISSVIGLSSTSFAQDEGFTNQVSLVNEQYNQELSNEENLENFDEDIKSDEITDDNKEEIDTKKELTTDENSQTENDFKSYETNDKSLEKYEENPISNENLDDKNTNNDEISKEEEDEKEESIKNNISEDNDDLKDKNLENSKDEKNENEIEIEKENKNLISSYKANTYKSRSIDNNYTYKIEKEKVYRLDKNGTKTSVRNSWVKIDNNKYFSNANGYISKGIQKIGIDRFYFSNKGILKTNTKVVTNLAAYNIGSSGIMSAIENRWIQINDNKYHTTPDGLLNKGFSLIDKNVYAFKESNGQLEKNKLYINNNSIINIDKNGVVNKKRNTKTVIGNFEYTTDKDGFITGRKDLREKPKIVTSYIQGDYAYNKYNNNKTELARNSWVKSAGKDFRTNKDGKLIYGIHKIDGHFYNLTYNGLGKNYKVFVNNKLYDFDKSGKGKLISNNYKPNKDLDVTIGWMYQAMNFDYEYDMDWPYRDQIGYADCSSAVYRAMKHGGFISKNTANGNTETLFDLGRRGQVLKQISEKDIRYGDIFVAGVPGKSLGAGGHTGFILDKNTIIHCNWTDRGVSVTKRKGRMGDNSFPVRYYRLVNGKSGKYKI